MPKFYLTTCFLASYLHMIISPIAYHHITDYIDSCCRPKTIKKSKPLKLPSFIKKGDGCNKRSGARERGFSINLFKSKVWSPPFPHNIN